MDSGSENGKSDGMSKQWLLAKKTAERLGYVPSSFTVAVRGLINDHFNNQTTLRPVTKFQIARLLRGPSFKAMLYFATRDLRGEYLKDQPSWSVGMMMDLFEPLDLASMLAAFVFYRKSRKLLGEEGWPLVEKHLSPESQIAAQVGIYVPAIGMGLSLLGCAFGYFASAAILLAHPKEFKNYYRQFLNKSYVNRTAQKEEELFGCSTSQIAVFLLSTFGFGTEISNAMNISYDPACEFDSIRDDLPLRMKAARLWVEALAENRTQPAVKLPAKFFPMSGDKPRMLAQVEKILGGASNWLERGKKDLNRDLAPHLFVPLKVDDQVPDAIKDVFSVEEISKMEEEDFDTLVDQIDAELEGKVPRGTVVLKQKEINELEQMME